MLVRDFIEDSLYNPQYGYFSKQVNIFNTREEPFNFNALRDSAEFQAKITERYTNYGIDPRHGPGRQIWHTPTELFKPYYSQAVAKCLVSEYLLKYFPYEDLVIYETGAGNGTLALDVLDYLQANYPEVYERTRYTIIEISSQLAKIQRKNLLSAHSCVKVVNQDVFRWRTKEPSPCFFLAMEVVDNFAHDLVRYDMKTLTPYQGMVQINQDSEFETIYAPIKDSLIHSYLAQLDHKPVMPRLLQSSPALRSIYTSLPFSSNLSAPEYIPTRLFQLLHILRGYFPRHRLLLTDFSSLPNAIEGQNGPVVQTRFQGTTVPCSTFMVKQGYFDIFFPTNFENLQGMYEHVLSKPPSYHDIAPSRNTPLSSNALTSRLGHEFFFSRMNRRAPLDGINSASGLPVGERPSSVYTHAEFLETYADIEKTRLQNGENPMLDYYENVKFLF